MSVKESRPSREAGAGRAGRMPVSGGAPAAGAPPDTGERRKDGTRKVFSAPERAELLAAYAAWKGRQADFCAEHGVSAGSLLNWRSRAAAGGQAALVPLRVRAGKASRASRVVRRRRVSSPEEKRAAVEAYAAGGTSQGVLARLFGVSKSSLQYWLSRYRAHGPQGLEPRPVGRPKGSLGKAARPAVAEAIVEVAREHPGFGLRRIRSQLRRFCGLSASTSEVARVLVEQQVERAGPPRRPRAHSLPRRFERARPNELWQSDITALWLAKASRHIYLVVFLDDASRYVVSWGLSTRQTSELVIDALLRGIAAHGKPKEVLTDQGRQYFAWRGKSRFQKVLAREGIAHVVSRAHHPETLGKCERLWKTVKSELWERLQILDLAEAQARLAHYLAHYNHQRPHQGLADAVPADRFFGVDSEVRRAIESCLQENELLLALLKKPRKPVYLVGQIDGQRVSLHGEGGKLVVVTPQGGRQEIGIEELGGVGAGQPTEVSHEGQADGRDSHGATERDGGGTESDRSESGAAAAPPDGQEAHALRGAEADAGGGAGPVGGGDGGGAQRGAPAGDGDPRELAGQDDARGSGPQDGAGAGALLAAEPGGAVGDAGGRAAPAAPPEPGRGAGALGQPSGSGPGLTEVGDRGAQAPTGTVGGIESTPAGAAGTP